MSGRAPRSPAVLLDPVFLDLVSERSRGQTQQLRGMGLIPPGPIQGQLDQVAFKLRALPFDRQIVRVDADRPSRERRSSHPPLVGPRALHEAPQ